jgi:hypothetical protein
VPLGVLAIVVAWVGMALGFGLWMLLWPKHYWKTWKNYLKNGDPFESTFPGRTESLKAYFRRPNPNRRARILGAFFVVAGLTVLALLAFGILPLR